MTDQTTPEISRMSVEQLRAELAKTLLDGGLDLNGKAGTYILANFGDGSLLEWPAVRRHLIRRGAYVYMVWNKLADAYQADVLDAELRSTGGVENLDASFVYLSATAHRALRIALQLTTGRCAVEHLGNALGSFDRGNAEVMQLAFMIPLGTHRI